MLCLLHLQGRYTEQWQGRCWSMAQNHGPWAEVILSWSLSSVNSSVFCSLCACWHSASSALEISFLMIVSYISVHLIITRKASYRWQTRATLAKRLHGLRKSSGIVSCIASLPIDSLPMVSYYRPKVTLCVKCTAFEIFTFQNYRDLETGVRGHSRSSKVTPFDSLHMVSYYCPMVTLCLKCTVFAEYRRVTDGQTDVRTRRCRKDRASIASRG